MLNALLCSKPIKLTHVQTFFIQKYEWRWKSHWHFYNTEKKQFDTYTAAWVRFWHIFLEKDTSVLELFISLKRYTDHVRFLKLLRSILSILRRSERHAFVVSGSQHLVGLSNAKNGSKNQVGDPLGTAILVLAAQSNYILYAKRGLWSVWWEALSVLRSLLVGVSDKSSKRKPKIALTRIKPTILRKLQVVLAFPHTHTKFSIRANKFKTTWTLFSLSHNLQQMIRYFSKSKTFLYKLIFFRRTKLLCGQLSLSARTPTFVVR